MINKPIEYLKQNNKINLKIKIGTKKDITNSRQVHLISIISTTTLNVNNLSTPNKKTR